MTYMMMNRGMARNASKSRYEALYLFLRSEIAEGRYGVGQRLPTEPQLCEMCGVSRTTVRLAIDRLVEDGVLSRQQGRGTFVVAPVKGARKRASRRDNQSFRVVSSALSAAPAPVAALFGLAADGDVYALVRLQMIGDAPVALKRYYAPLDLLADRAPGKAELETTFFDSILRQRRIFIARTNISAKPVFLEAAEAELLGVESGSLGLFAQRVGYNESARAVRISETLLAAERATLHWTVKHPYGYGVKDDTINFSAWTTAATE